MADKAVSVGVIGAGPWGENHIRTYCSLGLDVLVADIDDKRLNEMKAKYPIKITKDYKDILNDKKITGVSICAPASKHYAIASDFLRAGKHVLVEKPLALEIEDAKKLVELAKKNNLVLMVGHVFRYDPAIVRLKEEMKNGSFGKTYSIYTSRMGLKLPRSDVGATLNYATHDIDIMCDILGEKYPEEITVVSSRNLGEAYEDISIIAARFKGEVLGYSQVGWLTPKKMRDIIVTAEKKSAEIDATSSKIKIIHDHLEKNNGAYRIISGSASEILVEKKEPLKEELADFVTCIEYKAVPKASGEVGLRAIKILTAGLLSAKEKRTIKLDENGDIYE